MPGLAIAFDFPGLFFDDKWTVTYDDRSLKVKNGNDRYSHSIRIAYQSDNEFKPAFKSACHFLNELSWFNKLPVINSACVQSNGTPDCNDFSAMRREHTILNHKFKQEVFTDNAHLALGFFREGFSSESPFYRFISYFKIIELAYPKGNKRAQWVSEQVGSLTESKLSINRLERAGITDVGKWLYTEGRCALTHADKASNTVRDISDYDHWQDIVWANEIVKEMAISLITNHLNVPIKSTPNRIN
jgi:hypothetical protein